MATQRQLKAGLISAALLCGGPGCTETSEGTERDQAQNELTVAQIEQAVRAGCVPKSFAGKVARAGTDQVDLLIVVDRSASMLEELHSLSRELPKLAKALTAGDLNGDGTQDILPVQSLRVGITSSDLGAANSEVPSCAGFGDNANLYPAPDGKPYFEYTAGAPDAAFADLTTLLTSLDTDGCGFEQPFEATLAALSGEAPYADVSKTWPAPEPTDFLRERSVLAVLLVTDEDDCSALPPQEIFRRSTQDPRYLLPDGQREGLNVRCALHEADDTSLRSVDEFVARLKALRADVKARLVFGAFAGVPASPTKTPAEWLEDPAMANVVEGDPASDLSTLRAACARTSGDGPLQGQGVTTFATPARRIVRAAAAFGARGVVQSICNEDLATPLAQTFDTLASSFEPLPACESSEAGPEA
jgi:hypothetical protein